MDGCFLSTQKSEGLKLYKRKCYDILFDYFHGALSGRMKILEERLDINNQIKDKQEELEKSDAYKEMEELKKKRTLAVKSLNRMDKDLEAGQIRIRFN